MILSILNVTLKSKGLVTLLLKTPAASKFYEKIILKLVIRKNFFTIFPSISSILLV